MATKSVFYAVDIDASVTMDRIDRVWRGTRIFELLSKLVFSQMNQAAA